MSMALDRHRGSSCGSGQLQAAGPAVPSPLPWHAHSGPPLSITIQHYHTHTHASNASTNASPDILHQTWSVPLSFHSLIVCKQEAVSTQSQRGPVAHI